ncbi:hypothetical protein FRB97_006357 [Tulasnella sp. 331]|nr:hypothetical protein FRB97_006357 [Tulasnella sp. 331]
MTSRHNVDDVLPQRCDIAQRFAWFTSLFPTSNLRRALKAEAEAKAKTRAGQLAEDDEDDDRDAELRRSPRRFKV